MTTPTDAAKISTGDLPRDMVLRAERTGTRYIDALPEANYADLVVKAATYFDKTGWRTANSPVRRLLDGLTLVGVTPPADAVDAMARCDSLKGAVGLADPRPAARAGIARRLASGDLDMNAAAAELRDLDTDEDRRQTQQDAAAANERARTLAYAAAVKALRQDPDRLLIELEAALQTVLTDQAKFSDRVTDPLLHERWTEISNAAGRLRGLALDRVDGLNASLAYGYRNPMSVHLWHLDHAKEVKVVARGSDARPDGLLPIWRKAVRGESLELHTIAAHADEWRPGFPTATEVLEILDAQYRADVGTS